MKLAILRKRSASSQCFRSKSGQVLVGDHSRSLLPGSKRNLQQLKERTTTQQLSNARKARAQGIAQISFDQPNQTNSHSAQAKRFSKSTIALPRSMQQRVKMNAWRDETAKQAASFNSNPKLSSEELRARLAPKANANREDDLTRFRNGTKPIGRIHSPAARRSKYNRLSR